MIKRGLLNFSVDHLVLNIGFKDSADPKERKKIMIFQLLKKLKYSGINDSNTVQINDFYWEPFKQKVDIFEENSNKKHKTYAIHCGRYRIMRIEDVDSNSLLKQNLNYEYDFRITFHGTLFALDRCGEIDYMNFITPFLQDVSHDFIKHSVSRIDICSDIFGVSVNSVSKGIIGDKKHQKYITLMNINPITREPETFYYGKRSAGDWLARIYNKLLDIKAKGKEGLFLDYLDYKEVTRLEIELRSSVIKKFGLNFLNFFDNNFLFSIYKQTLKNKYVKFKIIDFLDKEMKKKGYESFKIELQKFNYNKLSKLAISERLIKNLKKLMEYEIPKKEIFKMISNEMKDYPNQKQLNKTEH